MGILHCCQPRGSQFRRDHFFITWILSKPTEALFPIKAARMNPILLFFTLVLFNAHPSHGGELELLSLFKASITNDPSKLLSSWNPAITFCKWHGITCYNASHVHAIDFSGKNISGELSSSIFQLPHIETINLSNNQFRGQIPFNIFSCSSLRVLNLSGNNFSGSIPHGWSSQLETLDFSENMISGTITEEIGSFSSLRYLDLGGNALVGEIPGRIANVTGLQYLTLASNQLVGEVPSELGRMKSLEWIYLGYNNFSGRIPSEIGNLSSLNHLDLVNNNLIGKIPSSLGNLRNLQHLFLYRNHLTGTIPESIFGLKNLISLDLSDNSLSSEISELIIQLQKLKILQLFGNNLTGKIPAAVCSLPRLQVLQLWSNELSGIIPENLGKQNNLTILDLSTNLLTGKIPDGLCASGNLYKLILFSNKIEGEIPISLYNCKSLARVRLENNRLSGGLSSGFTKLPLVYYLDVSGNNLSGRIDDRKWEMPSLQMLSLARNRLAGNLAQSFGSRKLEDLDLSRNEFSGSIPRSFGTLSELMQLKLSENKIFGEIPEELSSCKKLVSLDLSQNQLSGEIPPALAQMPVLGLLDLSRNQLTGEVPRSLGKSESLVQVNISYNHFHGPVPYTGAFLAINATAVEGNNICGGETITGLPRCKRTIYHTWWFVFSCCLIALAMFISAVFMRRRKELLKLQEVESKDGLWETQFFDSKFWKSITLDDILSSRKEENIIPDGRKRYLSYKGKSLKNNLEFVAEEINDSISISSIFWSKAAELGKVKHQNIVKMIGLCWSNNTGYIIYEHVEGKNLSEVLHSMSWERRRKIAIGVARGLNFFHRHCSSSVLVGSMSPENIIVDVKGEPRLRFSASRMLCIERKSFFHPIYIAAEAKEAKGMTEKSDVYGLGLILIEMLTGKSPADTELGVHGSVVEWARYCYSDCHMESWIDPMIRGKGMNDENKEIVEVMCLALQCTLSEPMGRPSARDVLKTLEAVKKKSSCV